MDGEGVIGGGPTARAHLPWGHCTLVNCEHLYIKYIVLTVVWSSPMLRADTEIWSCVSLSPGPSLTSGTGLLLASPAGAKLTLTTRSVRSGTSPELSTATLNCEENPLRLWLAWKQRTFNFRRRPMSKSRSGPSSKYHYNTKRLS